MLQRAGFSDLGDNDVAAAVVYMLGTLKLSIPETGKETSPQNPHDEHRPKWTMRR